MAKEEYKIEKEKLDALLEEVTGELNQILKSESDALSKAAYDDEPGEESSGSADGAPADDIAPEASSAPAEASAPAAPPAPEASAPEASPEASPEMSGEASAPPSVEELAQAYAELPPEQFELHMAAMQMVQQQMGSAPGAGPEASAPGAAPPAPPAPMAPPGPEASAPAPMAPSPDPLMGKAEKAAVVAAPKGNGGQIRKSEKDLEIEALKVQLADQGKALTQLVEALQTPIRKSVKGISEVEYIGKDGKAGSKLADLSKADLTKLLREKARDASLSKSDRALIVAYTTGRVGVEKLEHLLASAK